MLRLVTRPCVQHFPRVHFSSHLGSPTTRKSDKIAFWILAGTGAALLATAAFSAHAEEIKSASAVPAVPEARWINRYLQKYPEVTWLADSTTRKIEEDRATEVLSSKEVFGKKFAEFDRTITALRCLRLILEGNHLAHREFTEAQPEKEKLSWKSFSALHKQTEEMLESCWGNLTRSQIAEALEVALVLSDMGKSAAAREVFRPHGVAAPDHDDFYKEALLCLKNHPHLCPSYNALRPAAKELLQLASQVGHLGHMTHLEGTEAMFSELKKANPCYWVRFFAFIAHTCDVAGAKGHVNNRSSMVYTEPTHRALQAVKEVILSNKSESEMYCDLINQRALWIGIEANDPMKEVLVRVSAMLRLFTPEEGVMLKKAMAKLHEEDRRRVILQFSGPQQRRTPTYMPKVLTHLYNGAKGSQEKKIEQAVTVGLPFLAKALQAYNHPTTPLNFNRVAMAATQDAKALSGKFSIDPMGNIALESTDWNALFRTLF